MNSQNLANNALIAKVNCVLWDMTRPLEEDSQLQIFRFDDDEGRDTFWHSSAHILGQSHETEYGCKICIGPCTTRGEGLYYDAFCGDSGLNDDHFQLIEAGALKAVAEKQPFEQFVITLAEAREYARGMMRKMSQFTSTLLAILMKMLLDIEDDPAWHTAETEDEDAGETSNYSVGQECLDRLSISLGGDTIVPVASEQLVSYLAAPEWQKRLAALIALAQIAEGCSKVMVKNVEQVVAMVLNSFPNQHPRVRWAAINAIGQLSTDLGPYLQVQYHQGVLPALAAAMDDFQNPRVETHAASALLNFSENCTPDILTPYLNGIVSKLLVFLQNGKQMVQEGALTALASVADSSQDHFQKYHDAVIPYLKAIWSMQLISPLVEEVKGIWFDNHLRRDLSQFVLPWFDNRLRRDLSQFEFRSTKICVLVQTAVISPVLDALSHSVGRS